MTVLWKKLYNFNMKHFFTEISLFIFATVILSCPQGNSLIDEEPIEDESVYDVSSAVMLQAFTWQSCSQSKTWWNTIKDKAEEIKDTFDYVWFPPVSDSTSTNGYLPRQLKNYSSSYGSKDELTAAIDSIKPAKAVADIVINHRCGTTSWGDFTNPSFGTVKGSNYQAICSGDEGFSSDEYMKKVSSSMRGQKDSGDSYASGRDLDHTNVTVQEEIVDWMDELKSMGFCGWRYDYVRGYDGKYTGYYNEKTDAQFSVGEYWPENFNLTAWAYKLNSWVDKTGDSVNSLEGRKSLVFDFVLKGNMNSVFGQTDNASNKNYDLFANAYNMYRKRPGFAVTFVENHDTGSTQKLWPQDKSDLGAAYALILTHPGVPCVAAEHYFTSGTSDVIGSSKVNGSDLTYHELILKLIELRKSCGIKNMSSIETLTAKSNEYTAKITGQNASVICSLGNKLYDLPEGYTVYVSGTGFAVYTNLE
jgi:alpha-amylase